MLDESKETNRTTYAGARAAYLMAKLDPELAESIARSTERPFEKSIALGALAVALGHSNPQKALRLLDDAFDVVESQPSGQGFTQAI